MHHRIIPFLAPADAAPADPAYALTRVIAGAFLVPHGIWKLFGITRGSKEETVRFFSRLVLEPAALLVDLVRAVEFFGRILIALGPFMRALAVVAAITTATAVVYVHWPPGSHVEPSGVEFSATWMIVLLMIAVKGGGSVALDAVIGREFWASPPMRRWVQLPFRPSLL